MFQGYKDIKLYIFPTLILLCKQTLSDIAIYILRSLESVDKNVQNYISK